MECTEESSTSRMLPPRTAGGVVIRRRIGCSATVIIDHYSRILLVGCCRCSSHRCGQQQQKKLLLQMTNYRHKAASPHHGLSDALALSKMSCEAQTALRHEFSTVPNTACFSGGASTAEPHLSYPRVRRVLLQHRQAHLRPHTQRSRKRLSARLPEASSLARCRRKKLSWDAHVDGLHVALRLEEIEGEAVACRKGEKRKKAACLQDQEHA